jgi:hypothetical protein
MMDRLFVEGAFPVRAAPSVASLPHLLFFVRVPIPCSRCSPDRSHVI